MFATASTVCPRKISEIHKLAQGGHEYEEASRFPADLSGWPLSGLSASAKSFTSFSNWLTDFNIHTGRPAQDDPLSPKDYKIVLHVVWDTLSRFSSKLSTSAIFALKTPASEQHYHERKLA